jgi:hypothetical protein
MILGYTYNCLENEAIYWFIFGLLINSNFSWCNLFWLWQDEELASVAGKQFVALDNPYGDVGYGPIRVSFLLIYFSCIYINKSMSGPIQTFYETNNVFVLSQ